MDKITRVGPPEAIDVADGIYSFVIRLNEARIVTVHGQDYKFSTG